MTPRLCAPEGAWRGSLLATAVLAATTAACEPRGGQPANDVTVATPHAELHFLFAVAPGDSLPLFRIPQVLVRADTSLVILSQGTHSLIWTDKKGRPLRNAGARGRGPGEFQELTSVAAMGSDVIVWDQNLRRITTFTADGELRGVATIAERGAWHLLGADAAQRILLMRYPPEDTSSRQFLAVDTAGGTIMHWKELNPGRPTVRYRWTHPLSGQPGERVATLPDCLPAVFEPVIAGTRVSVETVTGTVRVRETIDAQNGEPVFRLVPTTTTRSVIREAISASLVDAPAQVVEAAVESAMPAGAGPPVWSRLASGADGRLFLRRAMCVRGGDERTWDVVDVTTGRATAVSLPGDAIVTGGTADLIALVTVDSLDVEQIGIYGYTRPKPLR